MAARSGYLGITKDNIDEERVGLRVKDLRRRKGLTLDWLARETGLSKGHLSRFERGQKSVSLSALIRLAAALDIGVGTLLGDAGDTGAVRVVRSGETELRRAPSQNGGYAFSALGSSDEAGLRYNVFRLVLPREGYRQSHAYHSGREMVFIISGRVRFLVGDDEMVLETGDYAEFPGHLRHDLESLSEQSELLVIVIAGSAPPG